MNHLSKKDPALEAERELFISMLISVPIDTEIFTATFVQDHPHGGLVTFKEKETERISKGYWGVFIQDGKLMASLQNHGNVPAIFEPVQASDYRAKFEDLIVYNLFSHRNKA